MLIGWHATKIHILCLLAKHRWADDMVQVAKNEMWVSEVCFACLTWLYGLFVRKLISLKNAQDGCGRPTLNFIEFFWLGSVHSASKLNSQFTQMNYEMSCVTMHKCTSNSLSMLVSASSFEWNLRFRQTVQHLEVFMVQSNFLLALKGLHQQRE